jgi:hypothetical protein
MRLIQLGQLVVSGRVRWIFPPAGSVLNTASARQSSIAAVNSSPSGVPSACEAASSEPGASRS